MPSLIVQRYVTTDSLAPQLDIESAEDLLDDMRSLVTYLSDTNPIVQQFKTVLELKLQRGPTDAPGAACPTLPATALGATVYATQVSCDAYVRGQYWLYMYCVACLVACKSSACWARNCASNRLQARDPRATAPSPPP